MILLFLLLQSNMVSPFASHQQQIAMMSQQQSLLMAAAAANAAGGLLKVPGNTQQGPNGINLLNQNLASAGYHQFYGMMMPGAGKNELEKYMQVRFANYECN